MQGYIRKNKEEKPVVAICYDFDKTLTPDDMQAQGYIQSLGLDVDEFWKKSNKLANENFMDQNLAYMYMMVDEAEGRQLVNKEKLEEYGTKIKLFPGVKEWFERITEFGKDNGVIVEHYIISSGLKEMIEGTEMAKNNAFTEIYASAFYYNDKGAIKWPAQVINYTNKTQFLFRIEKGVLDINDPGVNEYFKPEDIRVPFRNMVYIGDSDTDIPCMKLVNAHGGYSIGVFNPEDADKTKVYKMVRDNRIKYFSPADYREGTELDKLIKNIIKRTAINEILENESIKCKNEVEKFDRSLDENIKERTDLINLLEDSNTFKYTHHIIEKLNSFDNFTDKEIKKLIDIAKNNSQVTLIMIDEDVSAFYRKILDLTEKDSELYDELLSLLG